MATVKDIAEKKQAFSGNGLSCVLNQDATLSVEARQRAVGFFASLNLHYQKKSPNNASTS